MSSWRVVDVESLDSTRREAYQRGFEREFGVSDEALFDEMIALGFVPRTAMLLPLLPLIQVAWADGEVTEDEARVIEGVAERRGLRASREAQEGLRSMLRFEPGAELAERCYHVLHELFEQLPPETSARARRDLLEFATAVAEASGGFLGLFGEKVEPEERDLLVVIAEKLDITPASTD